MSDRDRFDKFTERARRVLHLAQEEAQRLHHNHIGVEHILLGLVHEGEGVAAHVLLELGVDLQKLRDAVAAVSSGVQGGKQSTSGQIGLTSEGKKAIELAVDEARRLNHHYIGTEHLLLGLVRQPTPLTIAIFDKLGVKLEDVSNSTISILTHVSTRQRSAPASAPSSSIRDRFDRFSPQARKVLSLAQEEAQRFQHNYIASEHLLLGLLRQQDGLASQVLSSLGLELAKARETVEFIVGRGDRIVLGEIGLTPRAKGIVEQANEEATLLNSPTVETEHLLLAMVRETGGTAVGVLESSGIWREKIYLHTLYILGPGIANKVGLSLTRGNSNTETAQEQQSDTPGNEFPPPTVDDEGRTQIILERLRANKQYGADRFTEQLKRALAFSVEEAGRFHHNYIGTEHLLLGLIREPEGIAARVLAQLGVRLPKVRSSVEFIIGRGDRIVLGGIGLTPRSKKVIELATDEARLLNHDYIGTEHLLLGLVREGEGIASGVLESLGVNLTKVRAQVQRELNQQQ